MWDDPDQAAIYDFITWFSQNKYQIKSIHKFQEILLGTLVLMDLGYTNLNNKTEQRQTENVNKIFAIIGLDVFGDQQ